jgi:2-polyprenyl-3-methyl-5-hydroxy-6-metoxy-1,4-benzoquinol methylase
VQQSAKKRFCPLCGANSSSSELALNKLSVTGESYSVVRCNDCGMRYTQPLPKDEEMVALYDSNYYIQSEPTLLGKDFLLVLFERTVLWRRRRPFAGLKPGRVLDVGCGNGNFLAALQNRGWDTHGTDISEAACTIARSKSVTVHQGDLTGANFPTGFFDAVTLWHVIEHLPEPKRELTEIRRIIKEDGILVIETPNSNSLTFRICRESWYSLDVPRHLQHFTPETLEELLREVGFKLSSRSNFHHYDFTYTVYSYLNYLGLLAYLGIESFGSSFKQASLGSKALFLALGFPLALFCLFLSLIQALLLGNGETLTMVFKAEC